MKQGLSLNVEHINWARGLGHCVPGIHLSLSPTAAGTHTHCCAEFLFSLKFYFGNLIYVDLYVSVCAHAFNAHRGCQTPRGRVVGHLDLNSGLPQEQQVLLTTDPCLNHAC